MQEQLNNLNTEQILRWLREMDAAALERLWAAADRVRRENVGDEVHLRGLVEISNICSRKLRVLRHQRPADGPGPLPHEP